MMPRAQNDREHSALSRTVTVLALAFVLLGVVWYGISSEVLHRQWQDLVNRPSGPMSFRFILQPTMAAVAATIDGVRDAQLGRSPYFWTVLNDPEKRSGRLREGVVSTARIILLGIGMDTVYQLKVFGTFYPVEALLIAIVLAFIPYALLRGPVERGAHWWLSRSSAQ